MDRRSFLKNAGLGAGAAAAATTLAAPAIAQGTTDMVIVSTWPRDFPGLGTSAQRLAARIGNLTEGRINVQYFAAGERVGAFDSFDEVASGKCAGLHRSRLLLEGQAPGLGVFHGRAVRPDLCRDRRLDQVRRRPGALGRARRRLRPQELCRRQHRRADGWLVQQGNRDRRRPQGSEDAYPGPWRRRHWQSSAPRRCPCRVVRFTKTLSRVRSTLPSGSVRGTTTS